MSIVPAKECISTMIRFSPALHQLMKESAKRNGRSLNTEVNVLLELALGSTSGGGVADDLRLLREAASRIEEHALGQMKPLPPKMTSDEFFGLRGGGDRPPAGRSMPLKTKSFPSFSEWQQATPIASEEEE